MQVSFIVPLYNCLALTQAMIASLQATLPRGLEHEIILVDDGSTDGTRAWLASLPPGDGLGALSSPFRVLLNERNLGYAGSNNRGAAIATGRLLVLLNNDLVLTRGWLEPMLAAHRWLGARAGVVGNIQLDAQTLAPDHTGMIINLKAKPEHDRSLPPRWVRWLRRTRRVCAVTGACAMIERELWLRLGGFDEGFKNGGEDVDLCFRAHSAGRVNAVALRSVVRHHVSSSPGRKLRDEANSYRLALRWRHELEQAAYRRWCWDFLEREWTTPHAAGAHPDARRALAYALRLRRSAPPVAIEGMRAAMDHELGRWNKIFAAQT
jgi:GT2 family glycosyltransferase